MTIQMDGSVVFVDREAELETSARMAWERGARLVMLYGRRRVGKTELLLQQRPIRS